MFNKPHLQTSSNEDRVSIEQGLYDKDRMTNNTSCESLEDDKVKIEGTQDLNTIDLENNDNDPPKQVQTYKEENEANHTDSSYASTLLETLSPLF